MTAIWSTIIPSAFPWMKIFLFRLKCQRCLFPKAQPTIIQHWFRWWLGTNRTQAIIWTIDGLVYWHVYMRQSAAMSQGRDQKFDGAEIPTIIPCTDIFSMRTMPESQRCWQYRPDPGSLPTWNSNVFWLYRVTSVEKYSFFLSFTDKFDDGCSIWEPYLTAYREIKMQPIGILSTMHANFVMRTWELTLIFSHLECELQHLVMASGDQTTA